MNANLSKLLFRIDADEEFKSKCRDFIIDEIYYHKKDDRKKCEIHIVYPTSSDIETINEFERKSKDLFQENNHILAFIRRYENNIITTEIIRNHFHSYLDKIINKYPKYNFITEEKIQISDNKIIIHTSSKIETINVKRIFPMIQLFFSRDFFQLKEDNFEIKEDRKSATELQSQYKPEERVMPEHQVPSQPTTNNYIKENTPTNNTWSGKQNSGFQKSFSKPSDIVEVDNVSDSIEKIIDVDQTSKNITIIGEVFTVEVKTIVSKKSGKEFTIFECKIDDDTNSIKLTRFIDKSNIPSYSKVKTGSWLQVTGDGKFDDFSGDIMLNPTDIKIIPSQKKIRMDNHNEKRVELHVHSKMTTLDSTVNIKEYFELIKNWGYSHIALTDLGNVQAYPDFFYGIKSSGLKPIYGLESRYLEKHRNISTNADDQFIFNQEYIIFDIETTGFSVNYESIIELAAVKMKNGEIIDRFESFIKPTKQITEFTTKLTSITNDMVKDSDDEKTVLQNFYSWCKDSILVAHNAEFDVGFLRHKYKIYEIDISFSKPYVDTLQLSRFLFEGDKSHTLAGLTTKFAIKLENHHRAVDDALATGYVLFNLLKEIENSHPDIKEYGDLNKLFNNNIENFYKFGFPGKITLLAKNQKGIKELYKLVSLANTKYYYRYPRITEKLLKENSDNLLIGSSTGQDSVLFDKVLNKNFDEAKEFAKLFDYIELEPPVNLKYMIEKNIVSDYNSIIETYKNIIKIGKELDIPVVAVSNAHTTEKDDWILRDILCTTQKIHKLNGVVDFPKNYLKTTSELFEDFSFLDDAELSKELIISNTVKVASMIEYAEPFQKDLYTPKLEGIDADKEIRDKVVKKAKSIYGNDIPKYVNDRIEKELKSIISNGFSTIYLISELLVKKSLESNYLVGSRGSVGSSFVATMLGITEVNPLAPHYVCSSCKDFTLFEDGSVASGFDLEDKKCEKCGADLIGDGHDIPFETFLGFEGDKIPDIDLNFSGYFQAHAHNYVKELFGSEYCFRSGTISTLQSKTAYGFVKGYEGDKELSDLTSSKIDKYISKLIDIKRTTGQHPGGIIVVPKEMEIFDFTPIQFPADDTSSSWKTTHFDYHSIEHNLLKLDILGHDDPTILRLLHDATGIDPKTLPTNDKKVLSLFKSTESLGVTSEEINSPTGTIAIPEFGTDFVRRMLEQVSATKFSDLVQISGLSHGTDVWSNNAEKLIRENPEISISDVIGCRDDIMVTLIYKGLDPKLSFQIMESVRRGNGVTKEQEDEMRKNFVEEWYIDSCKKIKYMFPKAHAAAYVLMAIRIAWFKVYKPLAFYHSFFSVRPDIFELDVLVGGKETIKDRIFSLENADKLTPKEKSLLGIYGVALEMTSRGFKFNNVDINSSDIKIFTIIEEENALQLPLIAIDGLGGSAAETIIDARKNGMISTRADIKERTKVNKTVIEKMITANIISE